MGDDDASKGGGAIQPSGRLEAQGWLLTGPRVAGVSITHHDSAVRPRVSGMTVYLFAGVPVIRRCHE